MRNFRLVTQVRLAALIVLAQTACADARSVAGPPDAPGTPRASARAVDAPSWSATGLRRGQALAEDLVVRRVIGPAGGHLEIPGAGFRLDVPAGAVSAPTTFSVTALAGVAVAYRFEPHGTDFPVALRARQAVDGTELRELPRGATVAVGYFAAPSDLDAATGVASISQEVRAEVHPSGTRLTFAIPHFSGWLVHWRSGSKSDSTRTR